MKNNFIDPEHKNFLWTVDPKKCRLVDPDGLNHINVEGNEMRFARALCDLLNKTPIIELRKSDRVMDAEGVPKIVG